MKQRQSLGWILVLLGAIVEIVGLVPTLSEIASSLKNSGGIPAVIGKVLLSPIAGFAAIVVGLGIALKSRSENSKHDAEQAISTQVNNSSLSQNAGDSSVQIQNSNVDNVIVNQRPDKTQLDSIESMIKGLGDPYKPEKLLAKYPIGYVIFEIDYENRVFPYDRQLLDEYELNWAVTQMTTTPDGRVDLRLPDLSKKGGSGITNAHTGGRLQVGNLGGAAVDGLMMWGEILAIRKSGVVFLVGFEKSPF